MAKPSSSNNQYVCGVPYTIYWTFSLFEGTLADLDALNERVWFRIYNSAHPEYTPLSLGPALLSRMEYTHLSFISPGSGWDLFAHYHGRTAPTEPQWAEQDRLQLALVSPPLPNKPAFTAPAPGFEAYANAAISVEWLYSDPRGIEQSSRILTAVADDGESIPIVAGSSTAKAFTIPPDFFTLPAGVRRRYLSLYVSVSNRFNPAYVQSDALRIGILSTSPDKPVPSKPADDAVSYPLAALEVEFPFAALGGFSLARVIFEYYKAGEAAWSRSLAFDTAKSEITIPAGTFTLGIWYWRIATTNSNNELSPPSDARELLMIASAPLAPILTAPAAGSTVYNHQPVAYGWDYLNNAGVPQGAAQLQYRIGGAANWTTVDVAGASETWHINHSGVSGAVSWRARAKNTLDEWSPWSATSSYTLAVPLPVATPGVPLNVYVDPDEDNTFSWAAASPIGAAITSYELAWRDVSAGTWNALTGGAAASRIIPGGTLPKGTLEWRVRVTDADGRTGAWSAAIRFVTKDAAPSAPTLVAPVDVYLPVSEAVQFRWVHNSPLSTPQGSAEVRYRQGEGEWTTGRVADASPHLQLTAFGLSAGGYAWQTRTFNRDGVAGPWSESRFFQVTGAAVTPSITEANANGARPSVRWTAEGQVVAEVQVWQGGAMIDRYVAAAEGDAGFYRTGAFASPGAVILMVRDQNMYGFWSGWAQASVTVYAGTGDPPVLTAAQAPGRLAIRVDVMFDWWGGHAVYLYRDGAPIARLGSGAYLDYGARSGAEHAYTARAVALDGTYTDSLPASATLRLPCAVIAPADTASDCTLIRLNQDGPPGLSRQTDTASEQVAVSGRALPVTENGEHRTVSYGVQCAMTHRDLDRLGTLKRANAVVLYRDAYGRLDYCRLASVIDTGAIRAGGKVYLTVSIALDATDYDDSIAID